MVLNYKNKIKFLFIIICFLTSCAFLNLDFEKPYYLKNPPNCTKVNDTLFVDRTEISNIDYWEFMQWTKYVFGKESTEYFSLMPDTTVWLDNGPFQKMGLEREYFGGVKYLNYPVVGITQQQASRYAKWRSDRVFEMILISAKKIPVDPQQNRDSFFTIENYFRGLYKNIKPHKSIKYYPDYRLPTGMEWKNILAYSDEVNKGYIKKCKSLECAQCATNYPYFVAEVNEIKEGISVPTYVISEDCYKINKKSIHHIRGNVGEWTSENKVSAGGSWRDTKEMVLLHDFFKTESPNAWTGFRCVFQWKKWEE